MTIRSTGVALVASAAAALLAGCATASAGPGPSGHAAAQRARGIIATADLPPGHVITDGAEPLHLRLSRAPLAGLSPATQADADVTVTFSLREADKTMVRLEAKARLKLDLYISPDGERWEYTSSCPLSTFEMWPHPIPYLALANPRPVAGDGVVCD